MEYNYYYRGNIANHIRNIIISEIFKFLYINAINSRKNLLPKIKLCYQLNTTEIEFANNLLQEFNTDLVLVKKINNIDLKIYYCKKNNKSYIINMKISSDIVTGIYIDI